MKKKFWKITAFFMAVALTVTCFNLESLYVHAVGIDEAVAAVYMDDHGVSNEGTSNPTLYPNEQPSSLEDGQVWIGKDIVDNDNQSFTITLKAIGKKFKDISNNNEEKNPLKSDTSLIVKEPIQEQFDILGDLPEGLTYDANTKTVIWSLTSEQLTSDMNGNPIDNEITFTVKCKATSAGTYRSSDTDVSFTPDEMNTYYYSVEKKVETAENIEKSAQPLQVATNNALTITNKETNKDLNLAEKKETINSTKKKIFGETAGVTFQLKSCGWLTLSPQEDTFKIKKSLDSNVTSSDNTWWIKFSMSGDSYIQKQIPLNLTLIIDTSGSMAGQRMNDLKTALNNENGLINTILKANPLNKISVVTFNSESTTKINFTNNKETLIGVVNGLRASGGTATFKGIDLATGLYDDSNSNLNADGKNVAILLTDGLPGGYQGWKQSASYADGKKADESATKLKEKADLYTISYAMGLTDDKVTLGQNKSGTVFGSFAYNNGTSYSIIGEKNNYKDSYFGAKAYYTNQYDSYRGYYIDGADFADAFLTKVATSADCYFNSSDTNELQEILKKISEQINRTTVATNVTVTDVVEHTKFKYVDDLEVQYKKSNESEWKNLPQKTNDFADYYEIIQEKGNEIGGTLAFHFATITSDGMDVRFKVKANDGVYSAMGSSENNPDLPTNDAASVIYTDVQNQNKKLENGSYPDLNTPYVYIPNPVNDVNLNKTSTVKDWENRTYTVNLDANATGETIIPGKSSVYDIVMVLDESGSMADNMYQYQEIEKGSIMNKNTTYYIRTEKGIYRSLGRNSYLNYWYYENADGKTVKVDSTQNTIYQRIKDTNKSKRDMLVEASKTFVDQVQKNSPDSRIGIIGFSSDASIRTNLSKGNKDYNLLRVGNTDSFNAINSALNNIRNNGATGADYGFNKAIELFNDSNAAEEVENSKDRKKLVIFFTDGEPNHYSGFDNDVAATAIEKANVLKNSNTLIYSIGTFGSYNYDEDGAERVEKIENYMSNIASTVDGKNLTYTANNMDELNEIFKEIGEQVISHSYTGTITDIIDKRFELAPGEKEKLEASGATVVTKDGITTITWKNKKINKDGWKASFDIVAKSDFVGGNVTPTNDPDSGIHFEFGDIPFPKPTVNVKTLSLNLKDDEKTYFLGDIINVDELSEELIKLNKSELLLNDAQINELIKNKKLTDVEYSYPRTNDVVGTLNYEIKVVKPTDMSLENHKADKKGEKVEQYQLVMTYLPYDKATRENMMNEKLPGYVKPTEGNGDAASQSANGNMYVNVVAGEIDLTKFIDKQYTDTEIVNANQSFVFEITKYSATDSNKVVDKFYQTISFSANENKTQKTVKIKNLEKGYYTIREVSNWSWKYDKNSDDSNYEANGKTNEKIFIGDMQNERIFGVESDTKINGKDYSFVAISNFHNVKNSNNIVSDVASAINKFNN